MFCYRIWKSPRESLRPHCWGVAVGIGAVAIHQLVMKHSHGEINGTLLTMHAAPDISLGIETPALWAALVGLSLRVNWFDKTVHFGQICVRGECEISQSAVISDILATKFLVIIFMAYNSVLFILSW